MAARELDGPNMISVTDFVRQGSVWQQLTPTLEQVVRWANADLASLGKPIAHDGDNQRNSLISEVAFRLAEAKSSQAPISMQEIEEYARDSIMKLPRGQAASGSLQQHEWRQAHEISRTIQIYITSLSSVTFSPRIPGCGVVDSTYADILAVSELIEVKAVKRRFRSNDYRQALTYAAMLYASGTSITTLTLVNPRLAKVVSISLDNLAAGASARSSVELLQDLVECMIGLQVSA